MNLTRARHDGRPLARGVLKVVPVSTGEYQTLLAEVYIHEIVAIVDSPFVIL